MMKTYLAGICLVVSLLLMMSCAGAPRTPTTASGKKIEIIVLCDRGDPASMEERQYRYRIEVGQWMERDMINLLKRRGYEAALINSKNEFNASEDHYLLVIKMVKYNPGSSAARMLVGYGVGAASLDNSYELYGTGSQPLLTWEDGVGTSQHWKKLPRKLNLNAINKITERLSESK